LGASLQKKERALAQNRFNNAHFHDDSGIGSAAVECPLCLPAADSRNFSTPSRWKDRQV
jgi:hypothetical protein